MAVPGMMVPLVLVQQERQQAAVLQNKLASEIQRLQYALIAEKQRYDQMHQQLSTENKRLAAELQKQKEQQPQKSQQAEEPQSAAKTKKDDSTKTTENEAAKKPAVTKKRKSTSKQPPSSENTNQRKRKLPTASAAAAAAPKSPSKKKRNSDEPKNKQKNPPNATRLRRKWDENFEALSQYQALHGHIRVLPSENKALNQWCADQRTQHRFLRQGKSSTMNPDRIQRLLSIGFEFSIAKTVPTPWEERLAQLQAYQKEHGDCNVKQYCAESPAGLGNWCLEMRRHYAKDSLSQDRVDRLEALGFKWKLRDRRNDNRVKKKNEKEAAAAASSKEEEEEDDAHSAEKVAEAPAKEKDGDGDDAHSVEDVDTKEI